MTDQLDMVKFVWRIYNTRHQQWFGRLYEDKGQARAQVTRFANGWAKHDREEFVILEYRLKDPVSVPTIKGG